MTQPRLCLLTQTPPTRLLRAVPRGSALESLREGIDHLPSPGGVTRMLRGLTSRLEGDGRTAPPTWLALAADDASLSWGKRRLELVALPAAEQGEYARAKSALWDELHGLSAQPLDVPTVACGLARLGRALGERCRSLHEARPFDLFYAHDFQLLELARELPRRVPRAFRWHVPVRRAARPTRDYVARALDEYDAVVVSTRRYADELRAWGVRVPIHASYPYLDESRRHVVTRADVAELDARFGLRADDVVFVLVARMDPMKSHDVAIRALARIARRSPRAKLLLVGGGGFSGGRQGLGLSQAARWRAHLEQLAVHLRVHDRVVFTGGLSDAHLDVAITRSRAVLLPSVLEGFGLAAVEGWLYGKPVLVSRGAGVAELVEDGVNGHTFAPGDDATLATHMLRLAQDPDEAATLGAEGRRTARICHLQRGADDVWNVLGPLVQTRETPSRRSW